MFIPSRLFATKDTFKKFENWEIPLSRKIASFEDIKTFSERAIERPDYYGYPKYVFISHKHSDLEYLKGFIDYLKSNYKINPYIDSMDSEMPQKTCTQTAKRIKYVIGKCYKFILLATNDALSSKWCNWEVGIADKTKFENHDMAILPMVDNLYTKFNGNEYLALYPSIERRSIDSDEFIVKFNNDLSMSLNQWLNK